MGSLKIHKSNKVLKLALTLCLLKNYAQAQSVEFNIDALAINAEQKQNIDLSSFEEDTLSEGFFLADIYVNNKRVSQLTRINFLEHQDQIEACLTLVELDKVAFKKDTIQTLPTWNDGECIDVKQLDSNVKIDFDGSAQRLDITIPQAYLKYTDNWLVPEQRDYGVNGFVLDYNIVDTYYKDTEENRSTNSVTAFGNLGVNIDRWRVRADYQYQKRSQSDIDLFEWTQVYAFRDLPDLNAKLFVGENHLKTDLYDSVRFKGVSLFSDEQMMPLSFRGYAPQIRGTALSHATVIVSQDGRILAQEKVTPGPFVLSNLNDSINGTVDVTIREENGIETHYQTTVNTVPFMVRKGQLRYKFNIGKLSPRHGSVADANFIEAEASYGIGDRSSLYGGGFSTLSNNELRLLTVGAAHDFGVLGSASFDITRSIASIDNKLRKSGNSYRINYAKNIDSLNGQLNLIGYRFADKNFTSLSNYIDTKAGGWRGSQEKNLLTLSYSQRLPLLNASVGIGLSKNTYWNQKSNSSYNVNVNKQIVSGPLKHASVSLNWNQIQNSKYQEKQNNIFLQLSIPLQNRRNGYASYFSTYNDQSKIYQNNISYNDKFNDQTAYGVSVGHRSKGNSYDSDEYSTTGYINHPMSVGELRMDATYNNSHYSGGASMSGSMTATKQGIALHKQNYRNQSRMMIDAEGAKGISFNNQQAYTNSSGLVVISNVPSYYEAKQLVDVNRMPENVNTEETVVETALVDGSIGYKRIATEMGAKVLAQITLADGTHPPFGTFIYNSDSHRNLGIVAESGKIYLSGIKQDTQLQLKWGSDQICDVDFTGITIVENQMNQLICR